jgi:hypothetical protein
VAFKLHLEKVSTTRGSGWVNHSRLSQAESIHPLPRVVLTSSKRAVLGMSRHRYHDETSG